MEILGYFGALLVGLSLGLFGAGGSILTVPVLFYLFGMSAVQSTTHSLFIVGFTALIGVIPNMVHKNISYRTAIIFFVPSMIAVYVTQRFLMPAIPEHLFTVSGITITKEIAILIFFAIIMILASRSMIRQRNTEEREITAEEKINYPVIIISGLIIGTIAGIVGAGGGFLIIPALVVYAHIPIKKAVGTSLLIIAINSMVGFQGAMGAGQDINWRFIFEFSALTGAGILIGARFARFVNAKKLKSAFGWFVLVMGIYIIIKELFLDL